jgi:hypothetical protein
MHVQIELVKGGKASDVRLGQAGCKSSDGCAGAFRAARNTQEFSLPKSTESAEFIVIWYVSRLAALVVARTRMVDAHMLSTLHHLTARFENPKRRGHSG